MTHDVWRWGLVSMVAVFGAVVVTLLGMQQQSAEGANSGARVGAFLTGYGTFISIFLCAVLGGMAVAVSQLRTRVLEEMHRIGAYVAVFHDQGSDQLPNTTKQFGWHVWNRIDKYLNQQPTHLQRKLQQRRFHGNSTVYVLVLLVIEAGIMAAVHAVATIDWAISTTVAVAIWAIVATWLWRLTVLDGRNPVRWNLRWAALALLPEAQISAAMKGAGLRLERPTSPNP